MVEVTHEGSMVVYRRMLADSGIVVAGSNRVAADAVCVALMKQYGASRVSDKSVLSTSSSRSGRGLGRLGSRTSI